MNMSVSSIESIASLPPCSVLSKLLKLKQHLHPVQGVEEMTRFSSSSLRYTLTDEGLALAERLDSVEQRSTGVSTEMAEKEEDVPSGAEEKVDPARVVDLTGSDDGEESDDSSCRRGLKERLAAVRVTDGAASKGEDQQTAAASRRPGGGRLPPGSYDIVLCVDFIETTG